MAPSQKQQIERLSAENAELKTKLVLLTERLDRLEAVQEVCGAHNGEALVRIEAVEDNLSQLATSN